MGQHGERECRGYGVCCEAEHTYLQQELTGESSGIHAALGQQPVHTGNNNLQSDERRASYIQLHCDQHGGIPFESLLKLMDCMAVSCLMTCRVGNNDQWTGG